MEIATRSERSAKFSLQPLPDALTVFYMADMLRLACAALTHQAVAGQTYRFALLDTMLDATDKENLLAEPAVETYFHAYQMLKTMGQETETNFQRLKKLLEQHAELLAHVEQFVVVHVRHGLTVHEHVTLDYTRARNTRTALETLQEGVGVCRDFAHLAITFCRCLNLPARYVNG